MSLESFVSTSDPKDIFGFFFLISFREKMLQNIIAILRRKSPQHIAESFNCFIPKAVIRPIGDEFQVRAQRFNNVHCTNRFLRGQVSIIQDPIIGFTVFYALPATVLQMIPPISAFCWIAQYSWHDVQ